MYSLNIDPANPQGNPSASELRDLGVKMARFTFKDYTSGSYPSPNQMNFYTQKVREYSEAGISSLIILTYETYPNKPSPSDSDAAWDSYIRHLAQRAGQLAQIFSPWQPAFQIWNEPDLPPQPWYAPTLREDVYGRMLVRVYNAIKLVDATLPVIGAGLASGQPNWWARVLESQRGQVQLDANAIHPYGQRPEPNWPSPSWGFGYAGDLVEGYLRASNHLLWITEAGVSQLAGDEQAEYLRRFYNAISHNYSTSVKQVFWFCYSDGMVSPYGLRDNAGRPKPSYDAFRDLASSTPPPIEPDPYGVQYVNHNTPETAIMGQSNIVTLTLRNTGTRTWTAGGSRPFRVGYHWYNSDGSETSAYLWEDYRTNLPHNVPPNNIITLNCKLGIPRVAGKYELRWDLVEEMVSWFSWQGVKTLDIQIDVKQEIEPPPEPGQLSLSASHNNRQQGVDNLRQAIDNNPYTRWSTQSPQRPGMWFQIDLGKVSPVSHIRLDNALSPQDYPRGYIVKTSTDGHAWTSVAEKIHNTAPLNVAFNQRQARFIRIEQSGSDPVYWWAIHQIYISDEIKPTVSASHNNVLSGNDNLLQAIDGRLDTRWSSWALQRPGMWFEIDLNQTRIISGLTLDNAASPYDYPRGYVVFVSTDRRQWQEVARKDNNNRALDIDFTPRSARYIRIEQSGSANVWWSIYEVTIKSNSAPDVKFDVSASHHNVSSGGDNVLQAIDRNPVTRWSSNALQRPGMWFEIDLQEPAWVTGLILDNAASPYDYPRGYVVRVSMDRSHWMEVARNDHNSGPLDITFRRQCARYIKIEQTGSADSWWWSIHEIFVASEPIELSDDIVVSAGASHNNILQGADNLRQMIDGNPATRWSSRITQRPGMWVEFDLNVICLVRGVVLDNAASPNDYPRGYIIQVSTDRIEWLEVARNNNNHQSVDIRFAPHCARYIRIEQTRQTDSWWWSIHRVGIIA